MRLALLPLTLVLLVADASGAHPNIVLVLAVDAPLGREAPTILRQIEQLPPVHGVTYPALRSASGNVE